MKKLFPIFVFLSLIVCIVKAQDKSHEERMEKYRAEKVAFLTDKLDLSPAEAQKFWPVYNEMQEKIWELQKTRRELEEKVRDAEESLSDKQAVKLTRDFASNMQKESELHTKYNEEFLKILSPQKVLRLYNAEHEFRQYMFKKYRDKKRNGN